MRICVYIYIIIASEFTHYPSCQLKVIWLFIGLHTLNHGTTSPAVTAGFSYDFRWEIKPSSGGRRRKSKVNGYNGHYSVLLIMKTNFCTAYSLLMHFFPIDLIHDIDTDAIDE